MEGQWVVGGIESDSRKSFLIPVDKRDEQTLLPIIKKWIKPGTTIISDCWKAYTNLEKYGYTHKTLNHSEEFVNKDGDSTNKIQDTGDTLRLKFYSCASENTTFRHIYQSLCGATGAETMTYLKCSQEM